MNLNLVSTYYLMIEALNNGCAGLLPALEPIPMNRIFEELETRSEKKLGDDPVEWAKWFISDDKHGREIERANILIFIKTREMFEELARSKRIQE